MKRSEPRFEHGQDQEMQEVAMFGRRDGARRIWIINSTVSNCNINDELEHSKQGEEFSELNCVGCTIF